MNGRLNGAGGLIPSLRADINFAELASASWTDTTYTINGIDVEVINSARMDTIGPNGTSGVVMDSKTGTTHEVTNRDTGRLHVDLADVYKPGEWYLTKPMWVTLEFAAALNPGIVTTRQLDLAVDTGTGTGGINAFLASQLVGAVGGAEVRGFRSTSSGEFGSASRAIQPAWIGMLIEPSNVQSFAGTGTVPSFAFATDHCSPSASLSDTTSQSPGYFTPEAFAANSRTLCVAVAGKWTAAPILKRLRCYTLAPG